MVKCTKYSVVRIWLHDARVLRPVPRGAYPVRCFLLPAGHHGGMDVSCGKQYIHASFRRSMHAPVAIVNVTVCMVVEGELGEMRRHNSHALRAAQYRSNAISAIMELQPIGCVPWPEPSTSL